MFSCCAGKIGQNIASQPPAVCHPHLIFTLWLHSKLCTEHFVMFKQFAFGVQHSVYGVGPNSDGETRCLLDLTTLYKSLSSCQWLTNDSKRINQVYNAGAQVQRWPMSECPQCLWPLRHGDTSRQTANVNTAVSTVWIRCCDAIEVSPPW